MNSQKRPNINHEESSSNKRSKKDLSFEQLETNVLSQLNQRKDLDEDEPNDIKTDDGSDDIKHDDGYDDIKQYEYYDDNYEDN